MQAAIDHRFTNLGQHNTSVQIKHTSQTPFVPSIDYGSFESAKPPELSIEQTIKGFIYYFIVFFFKKKYGFSLAFVFLHNRWSCITEAQTIL